MQEKRLKDLDGVFSDTSGCDEDIVIYSVDNVCNPAAENQFNYGITTIFAGKINGEHYMTRGHIHKKEELAEVYYGVEGEGVVLIDDEEVPIASNTFVYIPPCAKHRVINTGDVALKFLTVFRADSGHNYDVNFKKLGVEKDGCTRKL